MILPNSMLYSNSQVRILQHNSLIIFEYLKTQGFMGLFISAFLLKRLLLLKCIAQIFLTGIPKYTYVIREMKR